MFVRIDLFFTVMSQQPHKAAGSFNLFTFVAAAQMPGNHIHLTGVKRLSSTKPSKLYLVQFPRDGRMTALGDRPGCDVRVSQGTRGSRGEYWSAGSKSTGGPDPRQEM